MQNYSQMLIAPKLPTMNADPSENLHVSSTDRDWDLIKIWTQTVPISQSYDQNKFLIVFIKENEAFFDKKQAWMQTKLSSIKNKLECSSGEPITSPEGGVFLKRLIVILDPG